MFTHMSSPQCNHQHCPHAFPIYVVYDQFQLYVHPLRQCKEAVTALLISSSVHTVSSKDVVPHVQTTSHHMGQGLESREDVPTPLCPNIAQICTLWSWWGVALSGSKMTPHSSSSDCLWWIAGLILSCKIVQQYWPLTIVSTGMGWSSISTFQLNNWHAWLSEHPDCTVQCSSLVTFGHTFQHSVISTEGWLNESMTCQPLKCGWGMHCLPFCSAADGWWQEKLTLVIFPCVEFTLHKLSIPQAVGEDKLNTCWRGTDCCSNYHAWNTVKRHWHDFELFPSSLQIKYTTQHFESTLLLSSGKATNIWKSWQSWRTKSYNSY